MSTTSPLRGAPRAFFVVVGLIVAFAAMRAASTVLVPLLAGGFLAVVAQPLHRGLRGRLPGALRPIALLVTMLALIGALAAVTTVAVVATREVTDALQERRPRIDAQLERLRERASSMGIDIPGGGSSSTSKPRSNDAASEGAASEGAAPAGVVTRALTLLASAAGGIVLALAFAALLLGEADEGRRRLAAISGGKRALAAIDEAAPAFRRYVMVKSITSALTGTVTGLVAWALGIPLAWVWGVIAFLLEYIPSIGSVLAIVPPVLMALADGGPQRAGVAFGAIALAQVIMGNVVDPRIEGKMMEISPTGVLVSVVFWGWLWGPVGALLAVPLTVAIVIACRHIPGTRGVATLIAGDGVDEDART